VLRVLQTDDGAYVDHLVGKDSPYWPDGYTCPRCGSTASGCDELELPRGAHTVAVVDLTAEELLAALHGLGLPDEQDAAFERISDILQTTRIKRVVGKTVPGTKRCVVEHLLLEDGTKVYLGASSYGAVVYRVVKPTSYVQRLLETTNEDNL
jgi:hypothetical protein